MYAPSIPGVLYGMLIRPLISGTAIKVTKILAPDLTVKVKRRTFGKNKRVSPGKRIDISLTIGIPNFAERIFIKKCLRKGEDFPIKKLLVEYKKGK